MFIDEAKISIKAGNGGNGAVSFRRELFVPKGGPDGGDGGDGGNVIVKVDNHCHGLAHFNRVKKFHAENGKNGMAKKKSGKAGENLILLLPPGTQVYHNNKLLYDLTEEGREIIIAKGGSGGWGNYHFATSIKQAPKWSKDGLPGETMVIDLELKTIADVGLVGLPNAGKSTLLSVISNAKPKIADYSFTTLEPNLGSIKSQDKNIIIADIPGLIEGASKGRGLGDKFLRHIERTKVLVHVIDAGSDDVIKDYRTIRKELSQFSKALSKKKKIVALNKIDTLSEEELQKCNEEFEKINIKPILISAATNKNIPLFINRISEEVCG